MIRALAKHSLESGAELIVVTAPPGFKLSAFASELIAQHPIGASLTIDISGCESPADLSREIIQALLRARNPEGNIPAGRTLLVLKHAERIIRAGEFDALSRWIVNLTPFARVAVFSHAYSADLIERLSTLRLSCIGVTDLAARLDPERLIALGFTDADRQRFVAEFGPWPVAWDFLEAASGAGPIRLGESAYRDLADVVDAELRELARGNAAAIALAVLARATPDELAKVAQTDDVEMALRPFDGYLVTAPNGELAFASFFRMRIIALHGSETAKLIEPAVEYVRAHDPTRALSIAMEFARTDLMASILAGRSRSERDQLKIAAEERVEPANFLVDDDAFIEWWRIPRTREHARATLERLGVIRERQTAAVSARRALAVALLNIRAHFVVGIADELTALLGNERLGTRLRSLAHANLAWYYAWHGSTEAFERLMPALDDEHPDTAYALERFVYIRSAGDRELRRTTIDKRVEQSRGYPALERGAATYVAMDGFFAGDDERLAEGLAQLRRLSAGDEFLARTLAYIDGTGGLDFESHPRFRAFAILLRAERETEYVSRTRLLRSAIAHADESHEIEIRVATRLALAYASPRDASDLLGEASTLVRKLRSDAFAEAIVNAERLTVAGCFTGIARRFTSMTHQRIRLGILDGTISSLSGETIAIAQRQFELMAFLALHENGAADRDAIIDAIWPDLDPTAATHALKTAAHRIRIALGDPGAILLVPNGYRLADSIETDVERLETILGSITIDDAPARLGGLANAYRTLAVGVENVRDRFSRWSWADRYLPRLESLLRRLAQTIAYRANLTNRFDFSHRIVADLRTLDEEDETAFTIAISSHLAAGDRVNARREYERYAALLERFGATPLAEMSAVFAEPTVKPV